MKRLIVNADDCGFSPEVNRAVKECFLARRITGTSVMPAGPVFDQAVEMLRSIGRTEAGVHLSLTGALIPCARDKDKIRTLVSKAGVLNVDYHEFALRYLTGKIKREHIFNELREQVKKAIDSGLEITHIDSHEHVHMFPGIFDIVLDLSAGFGLKYVRIPLESHTVLSRLFTAKDLLRHLALKTAVYSNLRKTQSHKINFNDRFYGHFHSGRVNDDVLCFVVSHTNEGVTELALHPGDFRDETVRQYPQYKNASGEYRVLLSGKWFELAKEVGVRLVSHSEAFAG